MLGQVLGSYRITGPLGEGGMGTVWRAEHVLLGSEAAVKVLLPQFVHEPVVVGRFFNEARAAGAIRHPGIVEIFDVGRTSETTAFIAMELLRGETLHDRLVRDQRLPAPVAVGLIAQIASALEAAHAIGVVHRDLKPDNVFLIADAGLAGGVRTKLLDFGIAKLVTDALGPRAKTRTGTVLGTPAYMAPEQCKGASDVDHRCDLYALGCMLFEMIAGRPPFLAHGGGEVMAMHIYEPAPRLRSIEPTAPVGLDELIARLLQKEPSARPASAREVGLALEVALMTPRPESADPFEEATTVVATGTTLRDPPPGWQSPTTLSGSTGVRDSTLPPRRRTPWLPIVLGLGMVGMGAVGLVTMGGEGGEPGEPGAAQAPGSRLQAPGAGPEAGPGAGPDAGPGAGPATGTAMGTGTEPAPLSTIDAAVALAPEPALADAMPAAMPAPEPEIKPTASKPKPKPTAAKPKPKPKPTVKPTPPKPTPAKPTVPPTRPTRPPLDPNRPLDPFGD